MSVLKAWDVAFKAMDALLKLVGVAKDHAKEHRERDEKFFSECIDPIYEQAQLVIRDYIDLFSGVSMAVNSSAELSVEEVRLLRRQRDKYATQREEVRAQVKGLARALEEDDPASLAPLLQAIYAALTPRVGIDSVFPSALKVVVEAMSVIADVGSDPHRFSEHSGIVDRWDNDYRKKLGELASGAVVAINASWSEAVGERARVRALLLRKGSL
jgi:hypothetical protein